LFGFAMKRNLVRDVLDRVQAGKFVVKFRAERGGRCGPTGTRRQGGTEGRRPASRVGLLCRRVSARLEHVKRDLPAEQEVVPEQTVLVLG
jgi:hypothetical protein